MKEKSIVPSSTNPMSFTGALATPHALATDAGMRAIAQGGNAIDAAITAAAVLTVVYPHNVALGGDLIALVRTPDGAVRCINASGWSGAAADAAAMRAQHGTWLPARGADAVTVPGAVRGWQALRKLGSQLAWERTLAPAQHYAEHGVAVAPSLTAHINHPENVDLFGTADFDRVFRPGGKPLRTGETFRQPALAETLAQLSVSGPDGFYTGALGERMVSYLRAHGSCLTGADFADFEPDITDPIAMSFRGLTVLTSPPNSHGFILLRALHAIDKLGLTDPLGAGLGTLMQIFRRGNQLRTSDLADPRCVDVDVERLLTVGPDVVESEVEAEHDRALVPYGDTVGIAAADSDGYAVSLIQSVYHAFGSGLIDPDTGVLFHNRGTSFSLDPASPNVLAPRKRPVHTLMPAMTTHEGKVRHVLATMGGQGQPQILAQLLLRALAGENVESAVSAPRAIVGLQHEGTTRDTVSWEADLSGSAREALTRGGLPDMEMAPHSESLGQANLISIGAEGAMTAGSDPRSDGAAVVANYPRHRWEQVQR